MPLGNPLPGQLYGPEFNVSVKPWVTGSALAAGQVVRYDFPFVSKFIYVKNTTLLASSSIAIGFTDNGLKSVNANFITIATGESYQGDLLLRTLFLSGCAVVTGSFQLLVGLTNIQARYMQELTGSVSGSCWPGVG